MFSQVASALLVAFVAAGSVSAAVTSPRGFSAPVKITGIPVYNVSDAHKHLFQPKAASKRGDLEERGCASYNTAALGTAQAMQSDYYNTGGYYQGGSGGGSAWTDVVRRTLISKPITTGGLINSFQSAERCRRLD